MGGPRIPAKNRQPLFKRLFFRPHPARPFTRPGFFFGPRMTDIATNEPLQLVAGDTWQWRRLDLADYPASSWSLKYRFKNAAGGFEITASAYATTQFDITVAAATTTGYSAGTYDWVAFVTSGSVRHTVDSGRLEVLPDLGAGSAGTAVDRRTHAVKVLAAIEAVLEDRASKDQQEYQIAGRKLIRMPIQDLITLRNTYRNEVRREQAAEKLANGLADPAKVYVRFGRA